jgi:hypothetical protein|tara:strand:- start:175 stop:696 length:522 start_codon:yes stop_codon:yes gene_type:complete
MKKITTLILILLIFNCNSNESNLTDENELNLVTGLNLIDSSGNSNGKFGNPNILTNNRIVVFPIPAKNVIYIQSNENINAVWIIPANAEKIYQQTDFDNIFNTKTYNENEIKPMAEIESLDLNIRSISLNLENLKPGYYRIFMKIENSLYWENIYVPDGTEGFGLESLRNFWN